MRPTPQPVHCIVIMLAVLISCSCNNRVEIGPPAKELGYKQPVTLPLQFAAERTIHFDTTKKGGIQPVSKKLDLSSLPSLPFDSAGFRPFAAAPVVTPFSFTALPDTLFNPTALPAKPLAFKTYVLHPAPPVKVGLPLSQKDNPVAIADLNSKVGMPANVVISIFKDSHGLLWISSAEGLLRYDGEQVQKMLEPKAGSVAAGLAEDNAGRIWFIEQTQLGVIDLHKGTVSYSSILKVPNNNISKIIKDRDGRLWIAKTA
ncbi:MAG TPA: two-component regulator propeller domain-containing protein, partial [Chitinophagaceae bacterium]|nr:two-component regulator propeller domain-containing protein [Chitinophagaceae bacterium]